MTPAFSRSLLLWLDSGGVVAIPNIRGGGEYGERWHQEGMLGRKQNSFDDFIAAAEWLIARGIHHADATRGGGRVERRPAHGGRAHPAAGPLFVRSWSRSPCWTCCATTASSSRGSGSPSTARRRIRSSSPGSGRTAPTTTCGRASPIRRCCSPRRRATRGSIPCTRARWRPDCRRPRRPTRPILLRLEARAGHGAGKPLNKILEELTDTWTFVFSELGVEFPEG